MTQDKDEDTASNSCRPTNKLKDASFLSRVLFIWPYFTMKQGLKQPLQEKDLPNLLDEDSSQYNLQVMKRLWEDANGRFSIRSRKHNEKGCKETRRVPSLHRALLWDYITSCWFVQVQLFVILSAQVLQSVALGFLIAYLSEDYDSNVGYYWSGLLVLCALVVMLGSHSLVFATSRKGMQYRVATIAAIYDKCLKLPSVGGTGARPGNIINLATNDVERFLMACNMGSYLFWGPFQALAVLVVGLVILGPAFAVGFVVLFLFVFLQFYLGKRFAVLRSTIAAITDQRVTLISQAVSGVRAIKMSGWELQFNDRIAEMRAIEIAKIQQASTLKAWNEAIFFACNVVVSLVIFVIHVISGGMLTPQNVFTTMTLINTVQFTLTKFVSLGIMGVSECYVSISRIQLFFQLADLEQVPGTCSGEYSVIGHGDGKGMADLEHVPEASSKHHSVSGHEDGKGSIVIRISNLTSYWNRHPGNILHTAEDEGTLASVALKDISLDLSKNELCCIIGTVGSGKSALLQLIAGELPAASGSIQRRFSTLAYVAQDPWIMNGSVKENIVMGEKFHRDWYDKVIAACGLAVDLTQFRDGDETIVGDRGVQCSGGQRARIAVARALYRDAEVLLLDDPLSAVDSKVGHLIFRSAIQGLGVKRGKCVVLATHQHQYIGESRCVLVSDGNIVVDGTYDDCILASKGNIAAVCQNENASAEFCKGDTDIVESGSSVVHNDAVPSLGNHNDHERQDKAYKEITNVGVVKTSTYVNYANAMGNVWVGIFLLLLFIATQTSVLISVVAFGEWAEEPPEDQDSVQAYSLMIGLGLSVVLLSSARAVASFYFCIKASKSLHDRMTTAVLRSKIAFFDTNPLGRILNRFSADVGSNDDMLPQTLYDSLMCGFIVFGGVVTSIVVLPMMLLSLPPLIWFFLRVRGIYVRTSRELKRLEGLARSPMFSTLSETLKGIGTIRANDAVDCFQKKFEGHHDAHSRAFFQFIATSRWLGFRLDSITWMLLLVSTFLAMLFHDKRWFDVDPGLLGLALTMLLQLAGTFQWSVRQSAEVVNMMVSVERVVAFGDLPAEGELVTEQDKEVKDWPTNGSIDITDLTVRYRPNLPPALNGVSVKIGGGKRVGVVGRTGSGKSTLIQALFRLLEVESGSATVDGVDLSSLGLYKCRTEMSVIPQTPVLFSGTSVRDNLDPFHEYDDSAIRDALSDVQMCDLIEAMPRSLDSIVADGGSNFSAGQRQLLCLARAILRKKRILVLDEPTANVDSRTDELLQQALRRSFGSDSTIISVAHRLDTIIDYDYILVMEHGRVLEYGSPRELILKRGGHFAAMVSETGKRKSLELRKIAMASN